jgi:hypothetical protein
MTLSREQIIEGCARRLFGPLNYVWDARWAELHETGLTYTKWSRDELVEPRAYYIGLATTALDYYEHVRALLTSDGEP